MSITVRNRDGGTRPFGEALVTAIRAHGHSFLRGAEPERGVMPGIMASPLELLIALGRRGHGRRRTATLSNTGGDRVRLLVFCHAGCRQEVALKILRARG